MGWIILIEQDNTLVKDVNEALATVDPKIEVIRFQTPREFSDWLKKFAGKDPAVLEKIPNSTFLGIITDITGWNFRDIRLVEKFRPVFATLGFSKPEDHLFVILTGFDSPSKKRYEHRSITNFIYKPFDKLILRQILEIAIAGQTPVKKYHIHNFTTDAQIEMLKEIRLSEVSEIGFSTVSDQKVDLGKTAKYYAPFLQTSQHKSALAKAISCNQIPGTQSYRVELGFFALDQQQSFNLQKNIQNKKNPRILQLADDKKDLLFKNEDVEFILINHSKFSLANQLLGNFERFYDHASKLFESVEDAQKYLQESPTKSIVFIDGYHLPLNEVNFFKTLKENKNVYGIYLLSQSIYTEQYELDLAELIDDIFYSPFNKSYILKTLKRKFLSLKNKEEIFESNGPSDMKIHTSNPVKLIEVSEASLAIDYYRALSPGAFREFVFWMPNEVELPTLVGQCTYSLENKETKTFANHFVFFGQKEEQQKHIRLWIRHNYIEAKNSNG